MWDYTDKVMEHFRNPRNTGVIENADGTGEVGSMACGDALKLTFKLGKDGRIADAKFQTFGCASAIASASALTELIKGLTIAEAEKVTNQDVANFLGGLPGEKMHCSVLGEQALEAAIEELPDRKPAAVKQLEGRVVCHCFGVTEKEIEHVIRENHLTTVEEVTNYTKAGGGCGNCVDDIQEILNRINGEKPESETKGKTMTNLERIKLIEQVIATTIRPALQADGGDINLVDVDGNRVTVALQGSCAHCPMATYTMKGFVEAQLRQAVSDELIVEAE